MPAAADLQGDGDAPTTGAGWALTSSIDLDEYLNTEKLGLARPALGASLSVISAQAVSPLFSPVSGAAADYWREMRA